jgi:preprotein translocase subunit YajC
VLPSLAVLDAHQLAAHVLNAASTGSAPKSSGLIGTLPLLLVFAAIAYFLLIRPQRKRAQQAQQTSTTLVPGVEVLTRHGQYARVVSVDDDGLTLEVAPGVHSRFVKEAVARVITPPEPEDYAGPPEAEMIPDEPAGGAGPVFPQPLDDEPGADGPGTTTHDGESGA